MRLNRKRSITLELTLLFAITSTVVLMTLGFVISSTVEKHFEEQDMEVLTAKMTLTRHTFEKFDSPSDRQQITQVLNDALVGHYGLDLIVYDAKGETIFSTPDATFPKELVMSSAANHPNKPFRWQSGEQSYRGIADEVSIGTDPGVKVIVATSMDIMHHLAYMQSFVQTLWLFVAIAAAFSGLLGWVAVRRGLQPLRAMRDQAQVVTAQQLNRRVKVDSVPVELEELAQSLNDMLARLEEAFERLSDFSSDIAHELRTPVSNLMTETQVSLTRMRSADEYRSVLESNAEELDHMTRMISDMLLLAKSENSLTASSCTSITLAQEIKALFDYYDAVAEEKGLRLILEGDAIVNADRFMLRRAIGNIMSNAIRHSAPNGSINVCISQESDWVLMRIENTGDFIPEEYLERIFDRFFRVDTARQRRDGTGLGLAIAKSIVLAHGGSISAASSTTITAFTIRLPRVSAMR
ncbi:heavy metal sensor histidine kinase [Rhodoferax sp. BLA1]|uniref:heavy metal sensor histidine kinase n=1 Tax=Rhodoferax sp. BLA1 TaxID=2576062 RepID=UPI0021042545|nr:heavy metal sensor histidine kinase [Rhodoferax sp. BLA1]